MNVIHERFVLHPSVAVHWWLSSVLHEKGELLLTKMRDGVATVVVIEDIDIHVTRAMVAALRRGERLAEAATAAAELDVRAEIARLERQGAILVMPSPNLPQPVLQIARSQRMSEFDAACVALAEALQWSLDIPLILADRELYDLLQRRPQLKVMWLGDYG